MVPAPGPTPGKPAMGEGFQRQPRLITDIGIAEILRHPVMHMREDHIGGKTQQCRDARQQSDPEQRQAGEEQHGAPQREQQAGLADIRLHQQDHDGGRDQHQGDDGLGKGKRSAVRQHGGGQNGETGLEEFRGLQAEKAEIQLTPRAQHIGAEKKHQERSDQRQGEDESRR